MLDFIVSNFLTIALIVGLGLELIMGDVFEKKMEKAFKIALCLVFLLVLCDILDAYLGGKDTLNNLRYISTGLGYLIRPVTVAVLITILYRGSRSSVTIGLFIPVIIEAVFLVTTPFTQLVYYYDKNNVFYRGTLGYMPHFIGILYLVILMVVVIRMRRMIGKLEILTVIYASFLCISATLLETVLGYKYILPGAIICSYTVYYLYLYVQINNVDVMTDLLNRRSFYNDVPKISNGPLAIISIDLNNLKKINDIQGHAEGDKAICTVADVLKSVCKKDYRVYRLGGDEFMALGQKQSAEDAIETINAIRKEMEKTPFSLSAGFAISEDADSFDKACVQADMEMYEDKRKYKIKYKIKSFE